MPFYEYSCKKCKNRFTKRRPVKEATEQAECPDCGKKADRVFSTEYTAFMGSDGSRREIARLADTEKPIKPKLGGKMIKYT